MEREKEWMRMKQDTIGDAKQKKGKKKDNEPKRIVVFVVKSGEKRYRKEP